MRAFTFALILIHFTASSAPAQEVKAKPQPKPAQGAKAQDLVAPDVGGPSFQKELMHGIRAYMLAELHFARAACGLSKDKYKAVGKHLLGRCDQLTLDLLPAYETRGHPDPKAPPVEPTARVDAAIAQAVKSHATPAQWAKYQDELRMRGDDRRDTTVDYILLTMDHHLYLSARQRDLIRRSLVDHWQPRWSVVVCYSLYAPEGILKLPDDLVTPHLTPAQKLVWTKSATLEFDPFTRLEGAVDLGEIAGRDDELELAPNEVKEVKP